MSATAPRLALATPAAERLAVRAYADRPGPTAVLPAGHPVSPRVVDGALVPAGAGAAFAKARSPMSRGAAGGGYAPVVVGLRF